MKVHIEYTKGCCWRRVLDARLLSDYFLKNGYSLEKDPKKADINVLFTCAFIEKTEKIAFEKIKEFKKYPGKLIVSGCLPGINPKGLKKVFDGDYIGAASMENFDLLFPQFKIKFNQIKDANKLLKSQVIDKISTPFNKILSYYFTNFLSGPEFHQKFYLKIIKLIKTKSTTLGKVFYIRVSWGCNNRCAYCVEWKAVGNHKSKKENIILEEFQGGLKMGFRKFALVADDPGAWGCERENNLPDLLEKMIKESEKETIFIIDGLHPKWLIKDIEKWVSIFKKKKIRYLMIALQSGDDKILKKMNRQYTAKEFIKAILKIKKADPDLELVTQAIIGFPGETEKAFLNTLEVVKKCGFLNAVLFPYCQREGTVAASLKGEVPEEVIEKRIEKAKDFLGKNAIFHFHFEVDV